MKTELPILISFMPIGGKSGWLCIGLALSGCMGSGSSTPSPSELEIRREAARQLFVQYGSLPYTDLSMLPNTGQVQYSGVVSGFLSNLEDDVTDSLIGDLSVNISFDGTELLTGVANNFLDDQGEPLIGDITLSAGSLDLAGDPNVDATLMFDGTGTLTATDGAVLLLDADFAGDFLGQQNEAVGGETVGQVTVNGASQSFGGAFVATR